MLKVDYLKNEKSFQSETKSIFSCFASAKWAYDWKMLFNLDRSKPAQDGVIFKRKANTKSPVLIMNNIQVERVPYQKHHDIILNNKLDF